MEIIAKLNKRAKMLPSFETISDPIKQITNEKNNIRELNQNPLLSLKVLFKNDPKLLLIGSNIPTQFIPLFRI